VQLQGLSQREHVLGSVVSGQGVPNRLDGSFAPHVAMSGERVGIRLAGDDLPQDLHAGDAGDVRDHVVQLQIHLR
jgi:hypothetical protein